MAHQTIDQYIQENPLVWEYFKKYAGELINQGHKKIGAKMIFERIRWEAKFQKMGQFKCNNNQTAEMARKFEQVYPMYAGIFEKRICKKDKE